MGVGYIPLFVIFTVVLGNTLGFPIQPNEIDIEEFKLTLEKIGNEIGEFGTFSKWKIGAKKILQLIRVDKLRKDAFEKSKVQAFIAKQFKKTVQYLKDNPNVVVSQADKGGKVVIMNRRLYDLKMGEYLNGCVKDHTYFKCDSLGLDDVTGLIEEKYGVLRSAINGFLMQEAEDGLANLCYP